MPIDQIVPCSLNFVALYLHKEKVGDEVVESIIEKPILGFALVSASKSQDITPLVVNGDGQIVPQSLNDEEYLGVCYDEDYAAKQRLANGIVKAENDSEAPIIINNLSRGPQ